jgi:hypothetical protein
VGATAPMKIYALILSYPTVNDRIDYIDEILSFTDDPELREFYEALKDYPRRVTLYFASEINIVSCQKYLSRSVPRRIQEFSGGHGVGIRLHRDE